MSIADPVAAWLMEGDPAIRWQVMRDLKNANEAAVAREQRRIAREGWGAQLLALQDPDGKWGGGIYTPKWISTTYTMVLLRNFGLPAGNAQAIRACRLLLDTGHWEDGGINFWRRQHDRSETCVSSMVLAMLCWFGLDDARVDRLAEHVVSQQMADGGWNCLAMPGYGRATHGSFHTTISALEALLEYERFRPARAGAVREAEAHGREFLLVHRLFRSHRTGKVAKDSFTRFSFPTHWYYDVLRGLDYFRNAGGAGGFACPATDPRLNDALDLVQKRRRVDGKWPLQNDHPGRTFFRMEKIGEASRWNTLRALRVLRWAGRD